MAKKKIIEVPYTSSGQMLRRANALYSLGVTFIPTKDFEDTIQFVKLGRTTSSVYGIFISKTTKKCYYMFSTDLEKMITNQILKLGIVRGTFTFVKRGSAFGIRIISSSKLNSFEDA